MANATSDTDGLNRQTGDARYYLNTVTLDDITVPAGNVDINSHKLTNVALATSDSDAMPWGQSLDR